MTAVKAPPGYLSGWCGSGSHDRCRGLYGGVTCCCPHHTEPEPEPEPEPAGLRIGSLFSGYGGLEQGVQSVLGGTVAWHSEIDPGACKILAHRYPDVPNLGDITAVDWAAVEPVDVLCGGFPCQDVSAAGKRAGIAPGTRSGLWAEMSRAIQALRPPLVVIENVRGLLSADAHHPAHGDLEPCPWCLGDDEPVLLRALGAVLGDLADIGFDAEWTGLRAADVGAPHGRFRVFVVAWPAADTLGGRRDRGACDAIGRAVWGAAVAGGGEGAGGWAVAAYPDGAARGERRVTAPGQVEGRRTRADAGRRGGAPTAYAHGGPVWEQPVTLTGCVSATVAGHAGADAAPDADRDGSGRLEELHGVPRTGSEGRGDGHDPDGLAVAEGGVDWGQYGPAVRRWERCLGRPAPEPTQRGKNGQPRLSPQFVEFLMGLPAGWVTDVPGLTRNEQLKALGNGVVSQQCAAALRILLADAGIEVAA